MADIGSTIQQLREAKGYTQDQLAEKLFVSRQTISNYERNKSQPSLEMIARIAEVFDMDIASLLTTPRDKKAEGKLLAMQVGICLLLAVSYGCLYRLALMWRDEYYDTRLLYWVNILLKPGLWACLGHFFVSVIVFTANIRLKKKKWYRYIYLLAGAIGAAYLIIMLPFLFSWDTSRNWSHLAYLILGATWNHIFPGAYLMVAFLLGAALCICHSGEDSPKNKKEANLP